MERLNKEALIFILRKYGTIVWPLVGITLIILVFITSIRIGLWGRMPSSREIRSLSIPIASEVYTADSVLIGKYYLKERTNVDYDRLAPNLILALLATEDIRFFDHGGLDVSSMGRVLVKTIAMGNENAGGGSTITQQLAKNLYPRRDYGILSLLVNKLQEIFIAKKLEALFDKKQLITYYLNTVPFSENAYGIASATRRYFNTSPDSLQIEQSALLIGLLKAPTFYNPVNHPQRAEGRRNIVLEQMKRYNFISPTKCDSLKSLPLSLNYTYTSFHDGLAPYFREHLRKYMISWLKAHPRPNGSVYNLYQDGLKIYTTLDSRLQSHAEEAVAEHMAYLQKRFDRQAPKFDDGHPIVKTAMRRSRRYKSFLASGYSPREIDSAFQVKRQVEIFDWEGIRLAEMSPLDSVKYYIPQLQAGFVALDPNRGAVKAWVGGIHHQFFQYDHVMAKRQTGSAFKPIVYATALDAGVSPCDPVVNDRAVYTSFDNWMPRNSDKDYGGEYSMEGGLTYSVNIVAVNLILKTGPQAVIDMARDLGITSELPAVPSLALGVADVSLLDMTTAFGGMTNGGYKLEPQLISRVENHQGDVVWEMDTIARERVLSETHSQIMVEMLKKVVRKGTAASLHSRYGLKGDMVGKTGTSQDQADGWFLGATANIVGGSWVGADDRRIHFNTLREGQGARTALPIWAKFMKRVYQDPHFSDWQQQPFSRSSYQVRKALDCPPYTFMVSASEFKKWWAEQQAQAAEE